MTTGALSVSLLGPLRVARDGAPLPEIKYTKARALLAYLAVEAGRPHPRAELCTLLWPELPERTARRNLTQVLTTLRDVLGESALVTDTETAQLNPGLSLEVDVARFRALLDVAEQHPHRSWLTCRPCAERLAAAMTLYQGSFLSQLFVADSAPFEEWAMLRREQLRQRAVSALERLAQRAEWSGVFHRGITYARQLVELDTLRESSHRGLMRLLAVDGQAGAAEAQYQHLKRLLAAELDVPPEPETQRLHERIRAAPPEALRRYSAPPINGPQPPNVLIGRETEVAEICQQLRAPTPRVLTLTGAPGVGKTRLALAAAYALQFDFENGVHVVDLAPVADAALVSAAIAQALGVKEQPGQALPAALSAHLKGQHALLVLDNFEHVLEAAGAIADLIAACPAVKVLVTSRPPLRIRAEHQFPVSPLAPAAAVELFSERARAAQPAFVLTPSVAGQLAGLCAQVDYLPLAIELIAVRARSLALDELCRQLGQPLDALAHGARDLPARHRSLREAIAWSYDGLGAAEQRVFAHLGVFAGGCTAEAVQAVVGPETEALLGLEALSEASLVQARPAEGETRFGLLEPIRAFAVEALAKSGALPAAQQRHAHFFAGQAMAAEPELRAAGQARWLRWLAADRENLRAALTWAQTHDPLLGLQAATALEPYYEARGPLREGAEWLSLFLARAGAAPPEMRAKALLMSGALESRAGQFTLAAERVQQSLALFEALGQLPEAGRAHNILGTIAYGREHYAEAEQHYQRSLAIRRQIGDRYGEASVLNNLALCHHLALEYDAAERVFEASLSLYRDLGDHAKAASVLGNLGSLAMTRNEPLKARALYAERLALCEQLGWRRGMGLAQVGLGQAALKLGEVAAAREPFEAGLRLYLEMAEEAGLAECLVGLADVARAGQAWVRVAALAGAVLAFSERHPAPLPAATRERLGQLSEIVGQELGAERAERALAAGRALSLEAAAALALEPAGG